MPEAGEIRLLRDSLQKYVGKQIISIKWDKNSKFSKHPIKNQNLIKFPLNIAKIWCRGKVLIFETKSMNKTVYLVSQMGMSGYWSSEKNKHGNLWFTFGIQSKSKPGYWYTKEILYFNDQRHFGNLIFTDSLTEVWKKHGPCLLYTSLCKFDKIKSEQNHISLTDYIGKLNNKRIKNKQICAFMLEQKWFSGIGNYLRAEILYQAKIIPDRKLCELSQSDKEKLYKTSLKVIYSAYKSRGPKGYYDDGKFTLKVYMKEQDPYGNPVVSQTFSDKRTMHWVPKIQI